MLVATVDGYCDPESDRSDWDIDGLKEQVSQIFGVDPASLTAVDEPGLSNENIRRLWDVVSAAYTEKEAGVGRSSSACRTTPGRRRRRRRSWLTSSSRAPRNSRPWPGVRCSNRSPAASCCRSSDAQWKDRLYSLDRLKEGIGLRGYGQRDPLVGDPESFALFQGMKARIDEEIVRYLWRLQPVISATPATTWAPGPARHWRAYASPLERAGRRHGPRR